MAASNPETQAAAPAAAPAEINEFENLLNKQFKPKTDTAKEAVQAAVKTLAEQALASTQSDHEGRGQAPSKRSSPKSTGSSPSRSILSFITKTSKPSKARGAACIIWSTTRKPMRSSRFG